MAFTFNHVNHIHKPLFDIIVLFICLSICVHGIRMATSCFKAGDVATLTLAMHLLRAAAKMPAGKALVIIMLVNY